MLGCVRVRGCMHECEGVCERVFVGVCVYWCVRGCMHDCEGACERVFSGVCVCVCVCVSPLRVWLGAQTVSYKTLMVKYTEAKCLF